MNTGLDGSQRIGHGQIIIVVGVEVELQIGITLHHRPTGLVALPRLIDTQRIGQHEAPYGELLQRIDHLIDIVSGVPHAVRPILQIDVDGDSALLRVEHIASNIVDMLLGGLAELVFAVFFGSLGEQVDDSAAALGNPVERRSAVHKTEHFDPIETPFAFGPLHDFLHGGPFAFAHAGRGDLDPVDLHLR